MLKLRLPFPPSVNVMYRRGAHATYLSQQGRDYKTAVSDIVSEEGIETLQGRLFVAIALSSPTKRKYDIDNRIKAVLDSLQDAGVFDDDEQIDGLHVIRQPSGKGHCKVVIVPISDRYEVNLG